MTHKVRCMLKVIGKNECAPVGVSCLEGMLLSIHGKTASLVCLVLIYEHPIANLKLPQKSHVRNLLLAKNMFYILQRFKGCYSFKWSIMPLKDEGNLLACQTGKIINRNHLQRVFGRQQTELLNQRSESPECLCPFASNVSWCGQGATTKIFLAIYNCAHSFLRLNVPAFSL